MIEEKEQEAVNSNTDKVDTSVSSKKKGRSKLKFLLVLILLIVLGLGSYVVYLKYFSNQNSYVSSNSVMNETEVDPAIQVPEERTLQTPEQIEGVIGDNAKEFSKNFNPREGFADLVEHAMPSVVNISAFKFVSNPSPINGQNIDPALRDLLNKLVPNYEQEGPPQKFTSLGSGFVVRSDGFIATNNHVIQGAENIQVTFADNTKYDAVVYATDPSSDIALLKIEANDLPTLKFGFSNDMRVGDWVIAIGNPFGLGGTVSSGIISAVGRSISIGNYNDFLQTDAAINRGNSGGPMINTKGEVVGVNTAIFSTQSGGSIGIGFAVPSDNVKNIIAQLIVNKKVVRGYLGVQIQPVTEDIVKALGLENANGALVAMVLEDGPAGLAGIKSGDVIYAVNDNIIEESAELPKVIGSIEPNTSIKVTVISEGQMKDVTVTVLAAPDSDINQNGENAENNENQQPSDLKEYTFEEIGIKVAEINQPIKEYFNLSDTDSGIIITGVKVNSIAQRKGLSSGMKIISINNKSISTIDELVDALDEITSSYAILVENTRGNRYFVTVSEEELGTASSR